MSKQSGEDSTLRLEAIQYFKSLLEKSANEKRATRLSQAIEHMGRYMRRDVRAWLCKHYPNTKNFFESENQFCYDASTGEITLSIVVNGDTHQIDKPSETKTKTYSNTAPKEAIKQLSIDNEFTKPPYLTELETIAVMDDSQLKILSSIMHEIECFHASFSFIKIKLDSTKANGVDIRELFEIVRDIESNDHILRAIAEGDHQFDATCLLSYLIDNYPTVFQFDQISHKISLKQSMVVNSNEVFRVINDTINTTLRHLIKKFLILFGPKRDNDLETHISTRHKYIIDYMYDNYSYTLNDFIFEYNDDFHCELEESNGTKSKIISAKIKGEVVKDKSTRNHVINPAIVKTNNEQMAMSAKTGDNIDKSPQLNETVNYTEQNSDANKFNTCCVCDTNQLQNNCSEMLSNAEFRELIDKHKACFLRKLFSDTKIEIKKRFEQSISERKATQTIATGIIYSTPNENSAHN